MERTAAQAAPEAHAVAAGYQPGSAARSRPDEGAAMMENVTTDISEAYPGSDDLFVIHREDDLANVMLNGRARAGGDVRQGDVLAGNRSSLCSPAP